MRSALVKIEVEKMLEVPAMISRVVIPIAELDRLSKLNNDLRSRVLTLLDESKYVTQSLGVCKPPKSYGKYAYREQQRQESYAKNILNNTKSLQILMKALLKRINNFHKKIISKENESIKTWTLENANSVNFDDFQAGDVQGHVDDITTVWILMAATINVIRQKKVGFPQLEREYRMFYCLKKICLSEK